MIRTKPVAPSPWICRSISAFLPLLVLASLSGCSDNQLTTAPATPTAPSAAVYSTEYPGASVEIVSDSALYESQGGDVEQIGFVCPSSITVGEIMTIAGPFGVKKFPLIGTAWREGPPIPGTPAPKGNYFFPGRRYATDKTTWIEGLHIRGTCWFLWNPTGVYLGHISWDWSSPRVDNWGTDSSSEPGYTNPGGCEDPTELIYDPYDSDSGDCGSGGGGGGGGGSGGGGGGGGLSCHTEFIVIEISYDGGLTWWTWWQGDATVCE